MTTNILLVSCEVSYRTILGNLSLKMESIHSEKELLGNFSLKIMEKCFLWANLTKIREEFPKIRFIARKEKIFREDFPNFRRRFNISAC